MANSYYPYIIGPPVRGDNFIGRDDILSEIIRNISNGTSCAISGERRIGKTSLLLKIQKIISEKKNSLPVYISPEAFFDFNQSRFLYAIINKIIDYDKQRQNIFKNKLLANFKNKMYQNFSAKYIEQNISMLQIKDIFEDIRKEKDLIILVDEFDILFQMKNIDLNFFSFLRYMATVLEIPFVIASYKEIYSYDFDHIISSPFFNIFFQYRLGLFSTSEALNLIKTPFEKSDIVLNSEIIEAFKVVGGQHPYLLNFVGHSFFEELIVNEKKYLSDKAINNVKRKLSEKPTFLFHYHYNQLSKIEKDILANLKETEFYKRENIIHSFDSKSKYIAIKLLEKGLVTAWGNFYGDR